MVAFVKFDEVATMGASGGIAEYRCRLTKEIDALLTAYRETNALRNPFKDLEIFILPAVVAALSWLFAKIIDASCDHAICEATELAFTRIYGIIFFAVVILTWK